MDIEKELRSSLEVSVTWKGPSNIDITASEVQRLSENLLQYSTKIQFTSIDNNYTGMYSCEAQVIAANTSYLEPSMTRSDITEVNISMYVLSCLALLICFFFFI